METSLAEGRGAPDLATLGLQTPSLYWGRRILWKAMFAEPHREFSMLLHWPSALLQGTVGSQAGPLGHLSAIIVSSMLKSFKPKAACSGERLNLDPRSWDPAMLTIASSAIFLVFGFDLKNALWLKAEEPLFTNTFLLKSSPSNSMFHATSLSPTKAAWLSV